MQKNYLHPVRIGDLKVPNNLWLAPLAGYSDRSLRILARRYGAGLAVTEMVSVEGLVRLDKRTWRYLDLEPEGLTVVQLFGKNDPGKFAAAARLIREKLTGFSSRIVDVNFGCPVRKVVRGGAGSALLKTPKAMGDIVRALKDAGMTVSAKIRSGFDSVNIEETVPELDSAGADVIVVHPRLATQFYHGRADHALTARARQMTRRILVASGDIRTPENALSVFETTGADAVMIGRRAVEGAYLFRQIADYLETGRYHEYSLGEIKDYLLEFAETFIRTEHAATIVPIRSAILHAIRDHAGARNIRSRLAQSRTLDELKALLAEWDTPGRENGN